MHVHSGVLCVEERLRLLISFFYIVLWFLYCGRDFLALGRSFGWYRIVLGGFLTLILGIWEGQEGKISLELCFFGCFFGFFG